jgi:hypothetical protein
MTRQLLLSLQHLLFLTETSQGPRLSRVAGPCRLLYLQKLAILLLPRLRTYNLPQKAQLQMTSCPAQTGTEPLGAPIQMCRSHLGYQLFLLSRLRRWEQTCVRRLCPRAINSLRLHQFRQGTSVIADHRPQSLVWHLRRLLRKAALLRLHRLWDL